MEATLRYATTQEDREAVYRLRYELYVENQGLFADEADHERRWLTDSDDADSTIVVAEVDGEIVGTIRITSAHGECGGGAAAFNDGHRKAYDIPRFEGVVDERDIILVTRLVVRPELRGGPLGCRLFHKVFEFAADHNAELILGTCEIHLVSHYRQLGFRPFGKLYNHATNGFLVPIVAVTGDFEFLEQVGATTLDTLRRRTRPTARLEEIRARIAEGLCIVSHDPRDDASYRSQVCGSLIRADGELCALVKELEPHEVDALLARSHLLTCAAEDALVVQGHVSRTVYVLLSGALKVRYGSGGWTRVDEPGALVGEVAMLTACPRKSDVVAGPEGARVLALSYGNLRRILAESGPLAAKFLCVVALGLGEKLVERPVAGVSPSRPALAVHHPARRRAHHPYRRSARGSVPSRHLRSRAGCRSPQHRAPSVRLGTATPRA